MIQTVKLLCGKEATRLTMTRDKALIRTLILILIAVTLFVFVGVIQSYSPNLVIQIAVYILLFLFSLITGLVVLWLKQSETH